MTAIDPHSEINLRTTGEWVSAELPLVQPVTDAWIHQYGSLARAMDVPAVARADAVEDAAVHRGGVLQMNEPFALRLEPESLLGALSRERPDDRSHVPPG